MAEFTGERLIPGEVDADLYNEHLARYRFVRRLTPGSRVLDAGCGVGYGTSVLSQTFALAIGFDNDLGAVHAACQTYPQPECRFLVADVQHPPFPAGTFDCAVSFEVIEHLCEPEKLVAALANLTKPEGFVVLSTPNREIYELSRGDAGPNPYHHHEFSYSEFVSLLKRYFEHVALFAQNHTPTISFCQEQQHAEVRVDIPASGPAANLEKAQFFIAVCSQHPLPVITDFLYAAQTGNVLFTREEHIRLLENELRLKNEWLENARFELQSLFEAHQKLQAEHDERIRWAEEANQLHALAAQQVQDLQTQLLERSNWAMETIGELERTGQQLAAQLEQKCFELQTAVDQLHETENLLTERTVSNRNEIAQLEEKNTRLAAELSDKCDELQEAITFLHQAEETIAERTQWAQSLTQQLAVLTAKVTALEREQGNVLLWLRRRLRPRHWLRALRNLSNRLFSKNSAQNP